MSDGHTGAALFEALDRSTLLGRYALRRVDDGVYWDHYESHFEAHDHPDVFFDEDVLAPRRAAPEGDGAGLCLHVVEASTGEVAAAFSARVAENLSLAMQHAVVLPGHRRGGLYSAVTRRVLAMAERIGMRSTTSIHAPTNLPILIAKMRLGFYATGFEVDAGDGICLRLRHFHDAATLQAFRFRCGDMRLSGRLIAAAGGTLDPLRDALVAAGDAASAAGDAASAAEDAASAAEDAASAAEDAASAAEDAASAAGDAASAAGDAASAADVDGS